MARATKRHIRSPQNGRVSLCGRMSVKMASKDSLATCKVCQGLTVSGVLERERFEKKLAGDGNNQSGQPQYTEMQRAFAAHPVVTTNPRKAAIESGYSKSYAKSHAHLLRKQLAPLIMQHQEMAQQRSAISTAKVQQELAAMGFANIVDYFDVMDDGSMIPKKVGDLTREQTAAIQEIQMVEYQNPATGEMEMRIGRLKLADKRSNLVELGKTLGMFNPKGDDDTDDQRRRDMLRKVPTDALEKAEAMLMSAVELSEEHRARNDAVEGEFKALPEPGAVESEDPNEV